MNIEQMDSGARLKMAKNKIKVILRDIVQLLGLHENNQIVSFSPLLSDQIPKSYAANAFNIVQESLYFFEIVQLCTFWDSPDTEKSNIPTVVKLIDCPAVMGKVEQETEAAWNAIGLGRHVTPHHDPVIEMGVQAALRASSQRRAKDQAVKARIRLARAVRLASCTMDSQKLRSVMNIRHKRLAHRLEITREEKKSIVAPMKYGDEKNLLRITLKVVGDLSLAISGHDVNYEDTQKVARDYAAALWQGCRFSITR